MTVTTPPERVCVVPFTTRVDQVQPNVRVVIVPDDE